MVRSNKKLKTLLIFMKSLSDLVKFSITFRIFPWNKVRWQWMKKKIHGK